VFKFLKDKIKKAVSRFKKKVEDDEEIEEVPLEEFIKFSSHIIKNDLEYHKDF